MRKTLLLITTALAATLAASAQPLGSTPKADTRLEANPRIHFVSPGTGATLSPRRVTLPDNQRLVGFYTTDDMNNFTGLQYYPGNWQVGACFLQTDFQQYQDAKVVGMRFGLGDSSTSTGIVLYSVDGESQFTTLASVDETHTTQTDPEWVTIMLPAEKQFTLSTEWGGLMATYKYVQAANNFPIGLYTAGPQRNLYMYGSFTDTPDGPDAQWYNFGDGYGSLAIQLIVESDDLPANAVTPRALGTLTAAAGTTRSFEVTFDNVGTRLADFDYTLTIDGKTGEERHVTLDSPLTSGGVTTAAIPVTAPETKGDYDISLTVTKVNGLANGTAYNTAEGKLSVIAKEFKRGVVVEEMTGTGCEWCPRGLAGMKLLRDRFGKDFVGIAIHKFNRSDPCYTRDYAGFSVLPFTSAPLVIIDRSGDAIDPFIGSGAGIERDFDKELNTLPLAGVEVSGEWSADSTEVVATATVDPLVSGYYNIDFVLVADSLTGSNELWQQMNGYSQYTASQVNNEPYLVPFAQGGKYGEQAIYYPFDDVLIASSYTGTEQNGLYVTNNNAELPRLREGTAVTSTYTLTMPTGELLSAAINKKKVAVIAIVYNDEGVLNAAKTYLGSDPTGISQPRTAEGEGSNAIVARYNAAGQQVSAPVSGLNILKLANGKTVKVIK